MRQAFKYISKADGSIQCSIFFNPPDGKKASLLVALHTWIGDINKKRIYIRSDFHGPNNKPAATGSDLVVNDIVSAVEYAKKNADVDEKKNYLIGASGSGHAALYGKHP